MKRSDRNLGMDRRITRRDLLHGVGAVAAASFVPGQSFADQMLALESVSGSDYPPKLTGLRGNHPGSFEIAHQLAREGRVDWGPVKHPDSDIYDLVVVGAGISGLSAAYFFLQDNPGSRVLILDNHDDFGGHAKRNEFDVGDRTIIGYGGSQTMEEPYDYNKATKSLLDGLGVDLDRFDDAYDWNFYQRHGLAEATHFKYDDWGSDRLVRYGIAGIGRYLPLSQSDLTASEAVAQMPMSENARREMLHILTTTDDCLSGIANEDKERYLSSINYRDFLRKHLGVTEPDVFKALQNLATDMTVGIEAASAAGALFYVNLPGRDALGIPWLDANEPYIHHFPDGNASIARLLVRRMIPAVAPGSTMDDIVTAPFDYSKLDSEDAAVRLRLNSTVVRVEHDGEPSKAKKVQVTYVRKGQACSVQARACVLACYNAIIPRLCPELPEVQKDALAAQVKAPILYTTVALRNWRAWEKLGVGAIASTGGYHTNAMLDFPVSLGGYQFSANPDEPILVHMERFFHRANEGLEIRDQHRLGRHELFATTFETLERNIREQLASMLSGGDFDPASDIAGITVNRWAHGYADSPDEYYEDRNDERYAHVRGRKTFGRISIANSDAGARPILSAAVGEAHRAVAELS